jgi:hypothetical protein
MSFPGETVLIAANIGGSEIIVISIFLVILAVLGTGFVGLVYLILRAVLNRPRQYARLYLPRRLSSRNAGTGSS